MKELLGQKVRTFWHYQICYNTVKVTKDTENQQNTLKVNWKLSQHTRAIGILEGLPKKTARIEEKKWIYNKRLCAQNRNFMAVLNI